MLIEAEPFLIAFPEIKPERLRARDQAEPTASLRESEPAPAEPVASLVAQEGARLQRDGWRGPRRGGRWGCGHEALVSVANDDSPEAECAPEILQDGL
jgi:hypothetical protein